MPGPFFPRLTISALSLRLVHWETTGGPTGDQLDAAFVAWIRPAL